MSTTTRKQVYGEDDAEHGQQIGLNKKHSISVEKHAQHKRVPVFEYPPLPEAKLCFAIAIGTIAYGWLCTFTASQRWLVEKHTAFLTTSNVPFVGKFLGLKDNVKIDENVLEAYRS